MLISQQIITCFAVHVPWLCGAYILFSDFENTSQALLSPSEKNQYIIFLVRQYSKIKCPALNPSYLTLGKFLNLSVMQSAHL